jgi:Na+-driven multidrug efflux pump
VLAISLGLFFELELFAGLGAKEELFPLMSEYYRVILPFLLAQFIVIVMYFFIRLDGFPNLVAVALTVGALVNILLDYLFIGVMGFGLRGAAYATGISQALPMLVMMAYFISPDRTMQFSIRQKNWREVLQAAYNGISEFINEISGGIIVLIFDWMLLQRFGVVGVAAITVVNYVLMLGFMMFFSISDTIQVMVSQNFGARNALRMMAFLKTACVSIFVLSSIFIIIVLSFGEALISIFVNGEDSEEMVSMALDFVTYVWPIFLFAGTNMLISGYLTAIHLPFQSGLVALCRSLVFPTTFLIILYLLVSDYRFVAAIPLAELAAFLIALLFFFQHLPEKVVRDIK